MSLWNKCARLPGGHKIFSRLLGFYIPYTGSVGAEVIALSAGSSVVKLKDRRSVRNHLDSIHAVALMNIGELSTGLAVFSALPPGYRGILKNFEISYHKKSRDVVLAKAQFALPTLSEQQDFVVTSRIESEEGELLCEAKGTWRVAKIKARG